MKRVMFLKKPELNLFTVPEKGNKIYPGLVYFLPETNKIKYSYSFKKIFLLLLEISCYKQKVQLPTWLCILLI